MKAPAFKLPEIKFLDLPKAVQISLGVIGASLVVFVGLFFTLGIARDDAQSEVVRLSNELQTTQRNLKQSREDYDFIIANQERFDALMSGDKLIPHTRRTAIRQMQSLAADAGLTDLKYNFQAAGAQAPELVSQQPKSDLYRVYIETIELTLGAPLDQGFYAFLASSYDDFPGSLVVSELEIERAAVIDKEALNNVSKGQDSGLVKGKIKSSWRTAQQNQQDKKK